MGYKKTDIDWTDKFRGLMKSEGCRFICRDGYIFDNSSMCLKGDYEQRVSMMNSEEARAACQVLRYLARLTYCDFTTLMKEAQLFAEERKLPAVALDQNYISKLLKELIYLGAVSSRKYRDEKNFDDKLLNCFCMTGRGADLFKSMTEYSGYIEDMLINKNEIEVMRRLSVNYILTRLSSTISRLGGGVLSLYYAILKSLTKAVAMLYMEA